MPHQNSLPLLSILALCLCGCGLFGGLYGDGLLFGAVRPIEFRVSQKLNDNYPVAVELVVVYKKDLDKELGDLTAQEWFAQSAQYKKDFSTDELEAFRWEWVPGQPRAEQDFEYRRGARAAILFASYASPGAHRVRVEAPNHALRVIMNDDDFQVEAVKGPFNL